jgi:tetratricopeptide (TPR) repeat protein
MERMAMIDSLDEQDANDSEAWLRWYRKQIELNPKSTLARYKLGHLLAKLGRYEEAVGLWKSIIPIDPNHLAARLAIEEVLSRMEARSYGKA